MAPSNAATAVSSSSSTPAPPPRSPKRRRLSRNTSTTAIVARPAVMRSSSPDELADENWNDSVTARSHRTSQSRAQGRPSAGLGKERSGSFRRRRSVDVDAAGSPRDGDAKNLVDEDSPDELGDDVRHFWRGAQGSNAAARPREHAHAARLKAVSGRGGKRRAVNAKKEPAPLQEGATENGSTADQAASPTDQSPMEPESRHRWDQSQTASRADSHAPSRENDIVASRSESRDTSPEGSQAANRIESPGEALAIDGQEGSDQNEWTMVREKQLRREREREHADEAERMLKTKFRPYVSRMVIYGHRKGVAAVKFSPDGGRIASCCKYSLFL